MKFSDVAMSLKASEIRELLKLTTMPEIISFAGGLPAPELFPIEDMEKVDVEILRKEGRQAVQYGTGVADAAQVNVAARLDRIGDHLSSLDNVLTLGSAHLFKERVYRLVILVHQHCSFPPSDE